jgi:uncharacterized protein (TIGR02246 family)
MELIMLMPTPSRGIVVLLFATSLQAAPNGILQGQEFGTPADSTAILEAIANWERGWEINDVALASRDYSDDADWTNAFGTREIGRDRIRAMLQTVFQMPAVTAGTTRYEYHDVRFLSANVAIVRSRAIRTGQQLADGTAEVRRINHLRVFRNANDRWQIVSHLISDERTPGQAR